MRTVSRDLIMLSAISVSASVFKDAPHLKRNILNDVRNDDKVDLADNLRQVFRTGDRDYTVEQALDEWQRFCVKWVWYYRSISGRGKDVSYKAYLTYLNYGHCIRSITYTTNWKEWLQKGFQRVKRIRGVIPNEESVILLMRNTAMDKKSYLS